MPVELYIKEKNVPNELGRRRWTSVDALLKARKLTVVASIPPTGFYPVRNLYVDPRTGKLIVVYDDQKEG